jgi:negative regulator of flagellin synthesis FlgM
MKINGSSDPARVGQAGGGPAPQRTPGAGAAPAGGDRVRLSDLASRLAELETRLTASGEFDQPRVERIKAAIANGEYRINPEVIADRLVESVRRLLAGKA